MPVQEKHSWMLRKHHLPRYKRIQRWDGPTHTVEEGGLSGVSRTSSSIALRVLFYTSLRWRIPAGSRAIGSPETLACDARRSLGTEVPSAEKEAFLPGHSRCRSIRACRGLSLGSKVSPPRPPPHYQKGQPGFSTSRKRNPSLSIRPAMPLAPAHVSRSTPRGSPRP